ncbi:MAG TPA: TonB-dependent receptor plug domain-containing protein [Longimicrobiaceae bacterium]|nr:TonB-dependent receptor plug domain-containing protein [Longimicrobiaceae bacterium]
MILGSDLWARGGSLLDALAGRVSSIRVSRRSGGGCPSVMMRGQRTVIGNPSAQVYVDGTPMLDTCILNQIRVLDVARVEVYGGGVSGGTGHRAGPNGTILVFLTGSEAAR